MAVIDWPQSPIVDLYEEEGMAQDHTHIDWHTDDRVEQFSFGNSIRIRIRMRAGTLSGSRKASMKAKVATLDTNNNEIEVLMSESKNLDDDETYIRDVAIPMSFNVVRFRVTVSVLHHHAAHGGTAHGWNDDERIFTGFVEHFGDFSLDY